MERYVYIYFIACFHYSQFPNILNNFKLGIILFNSVTLMLIFHIFKYEMMYQDIVPWIVYLIIRIS